ncbi:Hypothetical predicted protein [Mytilus galloprovincialis]|uniref:Uncharacterized protein n=1 Tax=Mytilus galloprovincialis TaxID=29158 RepID=A0A8B6CZU2_MYTGA|nr:Hypothetical predicted protein [Mytilus galloprovincialis]
MSVDFSGTRPRVKVTALSHLNTLVTKLNMKLYQHVFALYLLFVITGEVGNFINSIFVSRHQLVLHNSALLLPGAEAGGRKRKQKGRKRQGENNDQEHTNNKRPSTEEKHEKGQARRQRDQERAKERKKKGSKGRRRDKRSYDSE